MLVILVLCLFFFFFSSRRRHTMCALVTGVQTCALPILGMTKLRHKIMADFDTWDGSSRIEDQSLGREDLEHWMKGSYLSVTKFQYVDYWIRDRKSTRLNSSH